MIDLVVFGASGSLSQKMLSPAIKALLKRNIDLKPIGYGRSPRPDWWKWDYLKAGYENVGSYQFSQNTIFYLALPIKIGLVNQIISGLKKSKSATSNWKIAVEKPFGGSYSEAVDIKRELNKVFTDSQIYPVDHYLTKDLVKNIISFRFANPIIEQIWKPKNIEKISVTAWEKEDITGRGEYYDQSGAIKDMIQNHLFSIMQLLTIPRPRCLEDKCLSSIKIAQIKKIKIEKITLGQYRGYHQEIGVQPNSKTETLAKLDLIIDSPQWRHVPITLETGKKLKEKLTQAVITFKNNEQCLWQKKCSLLKNNLIVINLSPRNEIRLYLNHGTKIDQILPESVPLKLSGLDISRNDKTPYEEILENIISGTKINFANFNEIIKIWKVMERIDLMKDATKLTLY